MTLIFRTACFLFQPCRYVFTSATSFWSLAHHLWCACWRASIRRARPPSSIPSRSFAMNNLLEVRDLHKSFVEGGVKIHVLRGLNLDLAEGERLAIVGQSGVGKSTLLHVLGTLDRPDSGKIIYGGKELPMNDED